MNIIYITAFFCSICFCCYGQNSEKEFILYGEIHSANVKKLIFSYRDVNKTHKIDTLLINNGIFFTKGHINEPVLATLQASPNMKKKKK